MPCWNGRPCWLLLAVLCVGGCGEAGARRSRVHPGDSSGTVPKAATLLALADSPSTFGLDVTVDRFDGGVYCVGEPFRVRVVTERAGYLYLVHVAPDGTATRLFPAPDGRHRRLHTGGTTVAGPGPKALFRATAPAGTHRLLAVVADQRLPANPPCPDAPATALAVDEVLFYVGAPNAPK